MTVIEKAHFYLEVGNALGKLSNALYELETVHENWLLDAKDALENSASPNHFTVSLDDIQYIQGSYLDNDFFSTYFGINQLNLLFYHRKYYFEDSRFQESDVSLAANEVSDIIRRHADSYFEDSFSTMSEHDQQTVLRKLRRWTLVKHLGMKSTNEISTLICKENTAALKPALLEMVLAKTAYYQAKYQLEKHYEKLPEIEQIQLKTFISRFESAELSSWRI